MKRLRDIVFENWMYHGSPHTDIKQFKTDRSHTVIDRAIGTHFSSNPDISKKFMRKSGAHYSEVGQSKEGSGKHYKVRAPKRSELEVVKQKKYSSGSHESDQSAIATHVATTVMSHPDHKEFFKKWVMHNRRVDEPTAEKIHQKLSSGKSLPAKHFGTASNRGSSFKSFFRNYGTGHNDAHNKELVHHYLNIQRKKGIKGLVYKNTSPEETKGIDKKRSTKSYVIHDPEHLKIEDD